MKAQLWWQKCNEKAVALTGLRGFQETRFGAIGQKH